MTEILRDSKTTSVFQLPLEKENTDTLKFGTKEKLNTYIV